MLSVTSGQQRWRFDTWAIFLIQLLLFVLYAGTCTATNVNTWVDCGNEGEVFVTRTSKRWVAGEEFCQTLNSHLVSSPQVTACKAMLVGILGTVTVQVSYTRLLDKLHFRDVGNNLKVSDSAVKIHQGVDDCSSQYLLGNSQPFDEKCSTTLAIVCGRNTSTQAASIVCDSHRFTYHSISFSADDANQTCYQQYGGRLLSTDGQELSCASKLLNTSQVLRNNNVSYIPVYTNATNGSNCSTYQPSTDTVGQDSCTKERPTICVSLSCNNSNNLVAAPNEDRCVCRPGYIRTSAHSCESIFDKLNINVTGEGLGSSNVTVFSLIDSEWRVHSVYTRKTLYQLANLSLSAGGFAIRSAERIIYTFSESLQEADSVAAELAKNHSRFFIVKNSSNDILTTLVPTTHLRGYLDRLNVWFRLYRVECINFTIANEPDNCNYSMFVETHPFQNGLYEFALSPLNSTILSVAVLYTVDQIRNITAPPMSSMPGNNASSPSDGMSNEGSPPSMVSSSPSGTDVHPPVKASMVGLYIGVGGAVLLAALALIVCLMVVVHHKKDGVSIQHQRSGALEAAGESSANNRHTSGTGMRYQSVKHGSSSSVTMVTATNSTQESTAAASSAQPSAPHPSQGPNYDNIELTAHPTSTVPSSTITTATTPGSGNEELSLHRPNRIPDAAIERAADNDYMAPHDLCLVNDAGEDDLMTAAATTSMVSTPNTNLAATPKSTTVTAAYKSATTPTTDASVSSAGTSATTPVFQSEEEARAASLPAAVAGPVYTEVFLTKKDVEPKRVLANPTAESVGLASDQDSYDSSIRGSKPPRTDYTPVIVYSKKTQNFCRGSVEEE